MNREEVALCSQIYVDYRSNLKETLASVIAAAKRDKEIKFLSGALIQVGVGLSIEHGDVQDAESLLTTALIALKLIYKINGPEDASKTP